MLIVNKRSFHIMSTLIRQIFHQPVGEVDVGGALHTPQVYLVGNENSVFVPQVVELIIATEYYLP